MGQPARQLLPLGSRRTKGLLCTLLVQVLLVLSLSRTVIAAKQESHAQRQNGQSIATVNTYEASTTSQPARTLKKDSDDAVLWCKMVLFDVLYASIPEVAAESTPTENEVFYGCYPIQKDNTVSELHYTLELPDAVVAEIPEDLDNWWIVVPGGSTNGDKARVDVPDADSIYTADGPPTGRRLSISQKELDRHHSRRLQTATGTKKVLVVYIRALDADPTASVNTVYQTTFENEVSLKHQYARCSRGLLELEPTELGVVDVTVNLSVDNTDKTAFVNAAEDLALLRIQDITGDLSITNTRQYADLIMFIVPPGTGNWLAYASVGGGLSVYNDEWGIFLSATAHEIGHNFRLLHAGEGDSQYSDHTGFMSGAIIGVHDQVNFPKQCYNAQNQWKLKWYEEDTMLSVTPDSPGTLVKVVAFADVAYANAAADKVLVQTGGNLDLYMQYNRAKGFNADTYEYKDKLVIVRDRGDGTVIEATLDKDNESVYTREEDGSSTPLRVEVCAQVYSNNANKPDYLVVGIGYTSSSLCTQQSSSVGLGGITQQQAACLPPGKDSYCSFDDECCSTSNCHNDSCSGISVSKDDTAYILDGTNDRVRGAASGDNTRGLRGLKGAKAATATTR